MGASRSAALAGSRREDVQAARARVHGAQARRDLREEGADRPLQEEEPLALRRHACLRYAKAASKQARICAPAVVGG